MAHAVRVSTRRHRTAGPAAPGSLPRAVKQPLDDLQRMRGNRAVAALLAANPDIAGASSGAEVEAHRAESAPLTTTTTKAPRGAGGARLRPSVQRRLEGDAGADLSGVRVHTGAAAGLLADTLGAEAVTHGGNIFFAPGRYAPGTAAGDRLLSHEVAHATRHDPGTVHLKRVKRHLDFVRMKRKDTNIARMVTAKALGAIGATSLAEQVEPDDAYGHWWIEVGMLSSDGSNWMPTKSYGWWPSKSVNIKETLKIETVPGQLNQGNANDPHHGDDAEIEFHPVMTIDDTESYDTIHKRVVGQIDTFAKGFSGSWNWRFGWGKNCHTFQDRMKKQLHLHRQTAPQFLRDPGADAKIQSAADAKAKDDFLAPWKVMKGMGGFILQDPERMQPNPMPTIADLKALSAQQKQWILAFIGCDAQTMNWWCNWHWMKQGDNTF